MLHSVTIGDNFTSSDNLMTIKYGAFEKLTALKNVTLGNIVTTIEGNVFENCTALQTIIIPDSVTSIDNSAFIGSGLTLVIMNPVVKDNLSLEFGSNQTFYGKNNVTIVNRETYIPEPEPEPIIKNSAFTYFTHISGTFYEIDIIGELAETSYYNTISKENIRTGRYRH